MAQVTLAKALKIKNRQARQVASLQTLIARHNSRLEGSEAEFDVRGLYGQLGTEVEKLIAIKAAINAANASVQETIYRMAELKGMITFLRGLSTQRGRQIVGYGMEEPQEYVAEITAGEVEAEVERLEREIERLQDRLDEHNATVRIELELPDEGKARGVLGKEG